MSTNPSIPVEFHKIIKGLLGNESELFFKSLLTHSPASIRVNPSKSYNSGHATNIPWTKWGKYLNERPVYTLDPLLHAGAFYVQEPSSMFLEKVIEQAVDTSKSIIALDLCAAPGGKSTHILSLLNSESLLISNEVIRSRASILTENTQKWGYPNVLITNNDPVHFSRLEGIFDLIVVDAPCSGEGLFRKDSAALNEWSTSNVELCSLRQRRILKDIWPSLKEGGILIYSTCTYNVSEDEETMEWLSSTGDAEFISIPLQPEWGVTETKHKNVIGYKFYPHKAKGEGFFISAVRKRELTNTLRFHTKNKLQKISREQGQITSWLKDPATYQFLKVKELICAVPDANFELYEFLVDRLNPLLIGTPLATDKRGKLVPEHAAALSIAVDHSKFPQVELNYEQAIQYLRKDPLELNSTEKGFGLVTYKNNPLGWVNLLSSRINNLYPSNWRIRMQGN